MEPQSGLGAAKSIEMQNCERVLTSRSLFAKSIKHAVRTSAFSLTCNLVVPLSVGQKIQAYWCCFAAIRKPTEESAPEGLSFQNQEAYALNTKSKHLVCLLHKEISVLFLTRAVVTNGGVSFDVVFHFPCLCLFCSLFAETRPPRGLRTQYAEAVSARKR